MHWSRYLVKASGDERTYFIFSTSLSRLSVSPSPVSFVCLQCMEEGANSLHHGKTAVQLMHTNVLQASCEIRARVTSKIGQKRIPCNTPIRAFDAHAGFQSQLGFRLTHSHKAGMAKRFFPSHIAWTSPHCRVSSDMFDMHRSTHSEASD